MSSKGSVQTISTLSPEQEKLLGVLGPYIQQRVGQGLPTWSGDFTAPLSEYEQTGLSQLGKYLSAGVTPTAQAGLEAYRTGLEGMSPEQTIDWYRTYIDPEERRMMEEDIIPQVEEQYIPGGTYWGSPKQTAAAGTWETYGTQRLSRLGQAIQSERSRATGLLPYLSEMTGIEGGVPQIEAAMTYGALPRQLEQAELTSKFEEFKRTTPELSPILDLAAQLLNIQTQTGVYAPGQQSPFMQLLPSLISAGAGLASGGMLASAIGKQGTTGGTSTAD